MSSKELMDGLNFVKDILIKPFFSEDEEGKHLKYLIDLKDNFLQGSLLIKESKDLKMLKGFMGSTVVVTELIYRATKDGFSSSTFHTKVDS